MTYNKNGQPAVDSETGATLVLSVDAEGEPVFNGSPAVDSATGALLVTVLQSDGPIMPIATDDSLGVVMIGENLTISPNGTLSADSTTYTLPAATTSALGGVIVGSGLNVSVSGVISTQPVTEPVTSVNGMTGAVSITASNLGLSAVATSGAYSALSGLPTLATVATSGSYTDLINKPTIPSAYVLPAATSSILGGVKIGSNVTVAADGTISVAAAYTLPIASSSALGGVKIGSNITVAGDGTISVSSPYALTPATASVLGGVKIGANVTVQVDGTISVAAPYSLPQATTSVLGGVIVGAGLSVTAGTVSANVLTVAGRTGNVVLTVADVSGALSTTTLASYLLASPVIGTPVIEGITNGTNAAAGQVGEFQQNAITGVSMSSGTPQTVTSLPLTAGVWDIQGIITYNPAALVTQSTRTASLNTVTNTIAAIDSTNISGSAIAAGVVTRCLTPTWRRNFGTATTVYLVGECAFLLGSLTCDGMIRATRVV
jgi:hypothetical protein